MRQHQREVAPALDEIGPVGRRRIRIAGPAMLWPFAVVALTPIVMLAGVVALIGSVALGMSRCIRSQAPDHALAPLAPVLRIDSLQADVRFSRAA